ncbi:MAG TPA: glycoside hydrolase family 32 protein [Leeuwenhoekiella sp.]|nr:glycoside hydrolase family 32 protein [Leeuwenhoekiella sp.]
MTICRNLVLCLTITSFLALGCKENKKEGAITNDMEIATDSTSYYKEPYRPQYHFSPEAHWMNDPNGLVFYKDTYHLFYQYYPEDTKWGPMHWGHATSKNLREWTHKPVALEPDSLGYIFSGSAVVDLKNTSGFGSAENPPMVAMFTYHNAEMAEAGRTDYQTQGIAYSLDDGDSWTKYDGNPVVPNIDQGIDFRDPKIFWHEASQKWILILVAGDHAQIYNSTDLKKWNYLSDFGQKIGAHGGVWECPDLFPLKTEAGEEKWVLLISINPGAPNGGSGTQYFVGEFDGKKFTTPQTEEKWIDWGRDNYAGITFNNLPEDRRIFIGWMSNWNYGEQTPTSPWRSAMTLPRKLQLHKKEDYFLSNYPVQAITENLSYKSLQTETSVRIENDSLNQANIQFTLPKPLQDFRIIFTNNAKDSLFIGYSAKLNRFNLDRIGSGKTNFSDKFANRIMTAPAQLQNTDRTAISIFTDQSSIEFFVDQGATVMTAQVFPQKPFTILKIESEEPVKNLKLAPIPSIWKTNYPINKSNL